MLRVNVSIALTAALLIISGTILLSVRKRIFDLIIARIFVLSPNSPIADEWIAPQVIANSSFYFFNWTNPEEIYNLTSKPKLQEVGPYKFTIKTKKVNITWNANDTVTYRIFQQFYFDEENSPGKLTDRITTLNTVTSSGVHKLKDWNYFVKRGFSFSLALLAPQIHVTKTVDELLFKGYQDPYVDLVRSFLGEAGSPVDKGGFMYGRNSSYTLDGVFNVANGVHENMGEILNWNYHNEIPPDKGGCPKLHGSIGDFFPRNGPLNSIEMFIGYICRNLKLDYEKNVDVHNINGNKYSAQHGMLDNGAIIQENKCYCNGECAPSGVMNVSACSYGAPAFLSLPHFYGADPVYLNMVEGLRPEKSKHELYLTVEPNIGFCLDIALRLQSNFLLHPVEHVTLYEQVPKIFFPVLWVEQRATVPIDLTVLIRILLSVPTIIIPTLAFVLVTVGCLILFKKCTPNNVIKTKTPKREQIRIEETPLRCDKDDV